MRCGLLGEKLNHSYSPQIHHCFGTYTYEIFEKKTNELSDFLLKGNYDGLNVTIPYKKTVIPFCKELTVCAQKLGAVNTIIKRKDGSLLGHNTDYFGFQHLLMRSGLQLRDKKVLVLGSGGASVTVVAVLQQCGAYPVVISRTGKNNYQNLHLHKDAAAIINTTPVGMYPNTGVSPISLDIFTSLEGVLDLIYNPARSKLLLDAESRGLIAMNGLWMLVAQAKESAEMFSGVHLSDEILQSTYYAIRAQMENIVLIGMPGCGKTTIGLPLSRITGKSYIDSDYIIEQRAGKTIPEIFSEYGVDYFRSLESAVLAELGKQSGLVIATGGGCVLRSENYQHLHQNGRIIWLERDINQLPIDGRPISQVTPLSKLYELRKPYYEYFADHVIQNIAAPDEIAREIAGLEVSS